MWLGLVFVNEVGVSVCAQGGVFYRCPPRWATMEVMAHDRVFSSCLALVVVVAVNIFLTNAVVGARTNDMVCPTI